ncbi:CdaR family transcriptional regulator [Variovorax sp. OV329]|uniref:PucR family transcriptional regulator n=1 Tax=Variovorax sp. OV329 TaxID=1882825 RepID=UPI00158762B2|nr:helix-turn-helix domain-containing protein [Variovorax sp. OV329]
MAEQQEFFSGAQPLSPRLRRLVAGLREDSAGLSERMLQTLRSTIPEYGSLGDSLAQDVYRAGVKNAELWYDSLLAGGRPHEDNLRWIGRFSQRRHAQALSLSALLQAYRTGTRVYMDAMLSQVREHPTLRDEMLFRVSPFLLYYSDLMSRTVSDTYLTEHSRELLWKEQLQARLSAAVFNPTSPGAFEDAARALGIAPEHPHVALALRLGPAQLPATDPTLPEQILEALVATAPSDSAPVARSLHHGHWLAWLPLVAGETADARERRLGERARQLLRAFPDAEAAGVGLPGAAAAGWRTSAEQAMGAIDLGRRLHKGGASFRYSDFALDTLMRQSSEMSGLCGEMVACIAAEPQLLETLETYFEHRQNHKVTAAALGIHRNTLLHRLAHIEAMLGASFDDMDWLSRIYLALRQRRLSRGTLPSLH